MLTIRLTKTELEAIAFCVAFGLANENEDVTEDRMFHRADAAMRRLFGDDWQKLGSSVPWEH